MNIRRATLEDYEKLKSIKLLSKKEELKYSDSLKPLKENEEQFLIYLKKDLGYKSRAIFIAEDNKEIIGTVLAQWFKPLSITKFTRKGYISNLYVKKGHRGKGVASKLVEKALEWLKEWKTEHVSLEIHKDNKAAKELYKKKGFKNYTVKMTKEL